MGESEDSKSTRSWKIVALVVAAVVGFIVIIGLLLLCLRKKCCNKKSETSDSEGGISSPVASDPLQSIMKTKKVNSVSQYRFGSNNTGNESSLSSPVRRLESDGQGYFTQLAGKMKVQSISDYKK